MIITAASPVIDGMAGGAACAGRNVGRDSDEKVSDTRARFKISTRTWGIAEIPRNSRKFRRYRVKVRSRISPVESGRNSIASMEASGSRRWPLSRTALYQKFIQSENLFLARLHH